MHHSTPIRAFAFIIVLATGLVAQAAERPNILWITSEDNSAHWLGCYGNEQAQTPRIDKLSSESITFNHAYSNAPVCAVARSTILTGVYAPTQGTQHMRSRHVIPDTFRPYVSYLREAGYYCTNNSKTDYNFDGNDGSYWDANGGNAHYRNRPEGKPFFAVFNLTTSHESSLFAGNIAGKRKQGLIPKTPRIDPANIKLPPIYPDLPEFREDSAIYYDIITALDTQIGKRLDELEAAGLADDTIVFYYSDHGGILPRSKRYLHDTGTNVPMIVRIPKKWQKVDEPACPSRTDELVAFIDLAPTVLSLAGVEVPDHMQGRPFLGEQREAPADPEKPVFLFADRFDEAMGMDRGITTGEYRYIRNFYPHLPAAKQNEYPHGIASWRAWLRAMDEGDLPERFQAFWNTNEPAAALFHTTVDPWEVNNLARNPKDKSQTDQMRRMLRDTMIEVGDLGVIPEAMWADLTTNDNIYRYAHKNEFPWESIVDLAFVASDASVLNIPKLESAMQSDHPVERYWGAIGCLALAGKASPAKSSLEELLKDPHAANRITAAHALYLIRPSDALLNRIVAELTPDASDPAASLALHTLYQLGATDRVDEKALKAIGKSKNAYAGRWAERFRNDR